MIQGWLIARSILFFKQKRAYEMSIGDWSSDVCSSDLRYACRPAGVSGTFTWPKHGTARHSRRRTTSILTRMALKTHEMLLFMKHRASLLPAGSRVPSCHGASAAG